MKKWKAPDYGQLDIIEKELEPLHKQSDLLQKKILKLAKQREGLRENIDRKALESLPKNPEDLTKDQWTWILQSGHHESSCHYDYKGKIFQYMGMHVFGFCEATAQPCITISQYGFNKKKVLQGIRLLLKHLKPETVVDTRHGTEVGIRMMLTGLEVNTTSVFYIHEDKTVVLYVSRWSEPKKFKTIKELLDWYETAKKED